MSYKGVLLSVITPFVLILTSCSVLSHSKGEIVVKGYERCGKCTQEAVERAIAKISNAGGGVVKLKKNGRYIIKPQNEYVFNLPSSITIDGNGASFFIDDNSNTKSFTWDAVFYANNKRNIKIRNLVLDSNGENNPVIRKPNTEGAHNHNGLFSAERTNNITIEDCLVTDVKAYGAIYLGYCDNVTIKRCEFYNIGIENSSNIIGDASVIMGIGENWVITNNKLRNNYLSDCGTGLDLACSHSVVSHNSIESFWAGANLANNGLNSCNNNILQDNDFINNGTAIYLWSTIKPFVGTCHDNIIRNNYFRWRPLSSWGVRGIDISFFVYGDVYNITLENNYFVAEYEKPTDKYYEIAINVGPVEKTYNGADNIGGCVKNVTIADNKIEGCSGPAILIDRRVEGVYVNNNLLNNVSSGGSHYSVNCAICVTNSTGVRATGPKRITISGNKVDKRNQNCRQLIFTIMADVNIEDNNEFAPIKR